MRLRVVVAIALVLFGCCTNVVFLEILIKSDSGAGNIITFVQFLFVAAEGLVFESKFFTKKPVIPVKKYLLMDAFFFTVSVINNYSLFFNVPLPLQMIIRSGSLVANMVLGVLILNKKYSISKYMAVVMVSIGIVMATMASANQMQENAENVTTTVFEEWSGTGEFSDFFVMCVGVVMLLVALFMSAGMGLYQEVLYGKFGKHPKEAMFYTHALPLPGFLLFGSDILSRAVNFSRSAPLGLGVVSIPEMWVYLVLNGLTQFVCISGVFILTTECPSLLVTLIITLRKFISLLFSIFYFQNPFTSNHWIATCLVFMGTALFTGVLHEVGTRLSATLSKPQKQD